MREWVVEQGVFEENEQKLRDILGERFISVKYTINGPTFSRSPVSDYVFYGTSVLGRRLQKSKGHKAICWLWDKVYDCNYYLPYFGKLALNNPHILVEAGTFPLLWESIGLESAFVKQNSGYKTFTGMVMDKFIDPELYSDDLLMLSPVRPIEAEWRFVIHNGSTLTYSSYGDIISCGDEAKSFVESVLGQVQYDPAPLWTLDICKSNGDYRVLEVNSLLSAGWYDCDVKKIVEAVDEQNKNDYSGNMDIPRDI
jgi:hypothetical protein